MAGTSKDWKIKITKNQTFWIAKFYQGCPYCGSKPIPQVQPPVYMHKGYPCEPDMLRGPDWYIRYYSNFHKWFDYECKVGAMYELDYRGPKPVIDYVYMSQPTVTCSRVLLERQYRTATK